jgi:ribosomal protein S18 acetylase RimI-like enzyme
LFNNSPFLNNEIKQAETRLSIRLDSEITIVMRHFLTESIISKLVEIDHEKFRSELWYESNEIIEKSRKKDFVCFILYMSSKPTAFLYGYDDDNDPKWFFLDTIATRVEGKGIGKMLMSLLKSYCSELGYQQIILYTEDQDEKGRKLRQFYESLGFKYKYTDKEKGIIMSYDIKEMNLRPALN